MEGEIEVTVQPNSVPPLQLRAESSMKKHLDLSVAPDCDIAVFVVGDGQKIFLSMTKGAESVWTRE